MEMALIVSTSEKGTEFLTELLHALGVHRIVTLISGGEARRRLLEQDFDLVIINAPLKDETGEDLSRHIAFKGLSQVILVVKSEHYDAISANCEDDGVFTIAKPVNKTVFWTALKLVKAAGNRLKREQDENEKLKQTIKDIRIVDRAKYILIAHMGMSEQDAHRYIEKQAMDRRCAKRIIAEEILKEFLPE